MNDEMEKGIVRRVGRIYAWSILGTWREVRENASRLGQRLRELRDYRHRFETFTDAVDRCGLTTERLVKRHDELTSLAVLYAVIVIISLGFLAAAPQSEHPINHALMSIGVMLVAGSKFLVTRFRIAQIKAKRFFGFGEWLRGLAK
jgi:hypothetical protein